MDSSSVFLYTLESLPTSPLLLDRSQVKEEQLSAVQPVLTVDDAGGLRRCVPRLCFHETENGLQTDYRYSKWLDTEVTPETGCGTTGWAAVPKRRMWS